MCAGAPGAQANGGARFPRPLDQPLPLLRVPEERLRVSLPNRHVDCSAPGREAWESEVGEGPPRPGGMVTCGSGILTRWCRKT